MYLPVNEISRPGTKLGAVDRIVWHWTGKSGQRSGALARYFELVGKEDPEENNHAKYVAAHYGVDWEGVKQYIPIDEVAYHTCDEWHDNHSIGIEICHKDETGKFEQETVANLVKLTASLCIGFDIDPDIAVIRHRDVTGKKCPLWFVDHKEEYAKAKAAVSALYQNWRKGKK